MVTEEHVTEGEAGEADGHAVGESREQEYEELARSIGLPAPDNWINALSTALLAVASGVVGFVGWVIGDLGAGFGGNPEYATGPNIFAAIMAVLTALLVIGCVVFVRRAVRQLPKERERKRRLQEVVAKDPGFKGFYREWVRRARAGRRATSG